MRLLHYIFVACLVLCTAAFTASAKEHDRFRAETASGILLPALLHDQVGPINANYAAILGLAEDALANNSWQSDQARAEFAEILAYTNTAHATTWWGFAPGDVLNSDANPWHLPTHAKLRGAHELLTRLHATFGTEGTVIRLYDKMNFEMNGLMGLCRYSDTSFNTAQPVQPDWSGVDLNVLYAQLGLGLLILGFVTGGGIFAVRRLRQPLHRQMA